MNLGRSVTQGGLERYFFEDFGMGRAAEGAREAIFCGFWDGPCRRGGSRGIFWRILGWAVTQRGFLGNFGWAATQRGLEGQFLEDFERGLERQFLDGFGAGCDAGWAREAIF